METQHSWTIMPTPSGNFTRDEAETIVKERETKGEIAFTIELVHEGSGEWSVGVAKVHELEMEPGAKPLTEQRLHSIISETVRKFLSSRVTNNGRPPN